MGQITHGYSLLTLMGTVPSRHFNTVSNPERDNVLGKGAHWYRSQGIAFSTQQAYATAAVSVQDNLISTMGRWASDCYKLYISTPLSSIANAQCTIAALKM